MKAIDLRKMSNDELGEALAEAKEELFNLRFQIATNQRRQRGQGFRGQGLGFATVTLFHNEALNIDEDEIGLPIHSAKFDRKLDFALRGLGGMRRCRHGGNYNNMRRKPSLTQAIYS